MTKKSRQKDYTTVTDLDLDLLRKEKYSEFEIRKMKSDIEFYRLFNMKLAYEKKKLINEALSLKGGPRVVEIDKILRNKEYHSFTYKGRKYATLLEKRDLAEIKNELNRAEGRDFYYVVNDRFEIYKIWNSDIQEDLKKGGSIGLIIVERLEKNAANQYEQDLAYFKKNFSKMSAMDKQRYDGKFKAYEILFKTIAKNKDMLLAGTQQYGEFTDEFLDLSRKEQQDAADEGDYPIMMHKIGEMINRL